MLMEQLDPDGSGTLDWEEFKMLAKQVRTCRPLSRLALHALVGPRKNRFMTLLMPPLMWRSRILTRRGMRARRPGATWSSTSYRWLKSTR